MPILRRSKRSMASAIVTETIKTGDQAPPAVAEETLSKKTRQRRRRFSLLTWRILAINVLALALLGGGLLFLGAYRQNLIDAELQSLKTQAQVFAAAVGEEASVDAGGGGVELTAQRARDMMRRLVEPTKTRAQLLDGKGAVIVDTGVLGSAGTAVQIDSLPPPERGSAFQRALVETYEWVLAHLPWVADAAFVPTPDRSPTEDPAVQRAFAGDVAGAARGAGPRLTLTAAAPVQY